MGKTKIHNRPPGSLERTPVPSVLQNQLAMQSSAVSACYICTIKEIGIKAPFCLD